jgi:hypothetical protein
VPRSTGSSEALRAAAPPPMPAARTAPVPYRVPAGECTASVVALGLCAAPDAAGGR